MVVVGIMLKNNTMTDKEQIEVIKFQRRVVEAMNKRADRLIDSQKVLMKRIDDLIGNNSSCLKIVYKKKNSSC